jgi:trans-aconitate 2-methyltransferase
MLVAARKRLPAVTFVEADVATWTPEEPFDLIYANATFQWVTDHRRVLRRLFEGLPSGGVLAVQMPDNVGKERSHTLMNELAAQSPFVPKFRVPIAREPIATPADYYDLLQDAAARVDVWHTHYNHPLAGVPAIIEMIRSTGLRPYLARLDEAEQAEFLARYEAGLAEAYPKLADGKVLYRFPRLFIVAVRA